MITAEEEKLLTQVKAFDPMDTRRALMHSKSRAKYEAAFKAAAQAHNAKLTKAGWDIRLGESIIINDYMARAFFMGVEQEESPKECAALATKLADIFFRRWEMTQRNKTQASITLQELRRYTTWENEQIVRPVLYFYKPDPKLRDTWLAFYADRIETFFHKFKIPKRSHLSIMKDVRLAFMIGYRQNKDKAEAIKTADEIITEYERKYREKNTKKAGGDGLFEASYDDEVGSHLLPIIELIEHMTYESLSDDAKMWLSFNVFTTDTVIAVERVRYDLEDKKEYLIDPIVLSYFNKIDAFRKKMKLETVGGLVNWISDKWNPIYIKWQERDSASVTASMKEPIKVSHNVKTITREEKEERPQWKKDRGIAGTDSIWKNKRGGDGPLWLINKLRSPYMGIFSIWAKRQLVTPPQGWRIKRMPPVGGVYRFLVYKNLDLRSISEATYLLNDIKKELVKLNRAASLKSKAHLLNWDTGVCVSRTGLSMKTFGDTLVNKKLVKQWSLFDSYINDTKPIMQTVNINVKQTLEEALYPKPFSYFYRKAVFDIASRLGANVRELDAIIPDSISFVTEFVDRIQQPKCEAEYLGIMSDLYKTDQLLKNKMRQRQFAYLTKLLSQKLFDKFAPAEPTQ